MNDLVRLTDLIADKRREIGDFVLATAGDVMSADMNEADRGQVALGLLLSEGKHNRLCPRCKADDSAEAA